MIRSAAALLLLLLFVAPMAHAQQMKPFTPNSDTYIVELQALFAQGDEKKAKKFFEETVIPIWNSGHFSPVQKDRVYKVSNLMVTKKKKAVDFENYIYALIAFAQSSRPASDFDAFHDGLEKVVTQLSRKQFTDYLEMCRGLFTELVLFDSRSVKWVAGTDQFSLEYDSIPKVIFGKMDLKALSKGDSSIIYGTSGVYYPTRQQWQGKGGRVDWTRAGFPATETYADLNGYVIDVSKPGYRIDSVTFHHPKYLSKPHIGTITEKILADVKDDKASYPRFDSYDKRIVIKEIFKDIDYEGGFSQHGVKFLGAGTADQEARFIFKKKNHISKKVEPFIVARSKAFVIRKDKVLSDRVKLALYYEGDSIFHPGIQMNYNVENHAVVFTKDKEGPGRSPFYDSYHKLELQVEAITWKLGDDWLEFENKSGGDQSGAMFESETYYDEFRYERVKGMADIHPLWKIRDYCVKNGRQNIRLDEAASLMKADLSDTKVFLINLANGGYLDYNYDKDEADVKSKLHHYVLSRSKKADYDVLQFESVIKGLPNGKLNLLNWDLGLNGVGRVFLSDSQNVIIYPYDQELTVKKNRDFAFDGKVLAGRLDFYGKEFYFHYDDFKIDLSKIDSLRLSVPDGPMDDNGRQKLKKVKTLLRDLKGELLVDKADNKSGLKDHPRYPIFNSLEDSYVYYDSRAIQDGAYRKEEFYMHLKPFSIDSVDNFTKEGLAFEGEFVSGGIFPNFEETLRLQPDFSLGFVRETPAGGYPVFAGKGNYKATIKLSHEGLRGDGQLEYLTSVSKSNDFLFYPDSVNGIAQDFTIAAQASGVQYPPVKGNDIRVHWMPKEDHFYAHKTSNAFDMYNGEVAMHGMLDLSPKGLDGDGQIDFADSDMRSKVFNFKHNDFHADKAAFKLKGPGSDAFAFQTENVKMDIDLKTRQGKFRSNTGGDFVDFPVNRYICYIDEFKWNIDQKNIDIVSTEGEGSRYVSTHPQQDSLEFRSRSAIFDLATNTISASEVGYINVADAIVHPNEGNVTVRAEAVMDPLLEAKIVANRTTKFHTFYDATVNISGKWKYTASAKYDYTDVTGLKQNIVFNDIRVDSVKQTYGEGIIAEDKGFTLSPNFDYKGKAKLFASRQHLSYEGSTRIRHDCPGISRDWLAFKEEIDPTNIYIPIPEDPKDANGKPISSGVVIAKDSTKVYPTFLSNKLKPNDIDIVAAGGYLHYDNESKEYRISNKEKLKGAVVGGNYVSLSENCIAQGQGKLQMGLDFGQIELTTLGTVRHNMNNDSTSFNIMMGLDFFFNDECKRLMAEKLSNHFPPLEGIFFGTEYEKSLIELVGKEQTTKLIQELNLYGSFKKVPKELNKTIMLTDVKLTWDAKNGSYRYKGFVGVASIGDHQVNKMMFGLIELKKKRNGDILTIYLEPSDNIWYFFNYQRGILGAIAGSDDFNTEIRNAKDDKRTQKGEKDAPNFTYVLSTEIQKRNFVRSFENKEDE
jgi:hypothetical protein